MSQTQSLFRSVQPKPSSILVRIWHALLAKRRLYRDQAHLNRLPDELLRDIGISRHKIDTATRRPRA